MEKKILEVKNLKKYFFLKRSILGKPLIIKAVDNVSFEIDYGKTLGLVGETGCGKTTLARCILRLIDVTDGEIFFKGINILNLNKKEMKNIRKDMQIIFQNPLLSLDPRMNVKEIIAEPLLTHTKLSGEKLKEKIIELILAVGLEEIHLTRYPHELSGGQNQRVAIARAIALNPKLLILDEPTSSLDVSVQAHIINLLKDLQEKMGLTYLFISHDLSIVRYISDEIAVMYYGKIVERGLSEEIFLSAKHPYTKTLLEAIPIPNPETKLPEVKIVEGAKIPINGCNFYPRCSYATKKCYLEEPNLKKINNNHYVACHKI